MKEQNFNSESLKQSRGLHVSDEKVMKFTYRKHLVMAIEPINAGRHLVTLAADGGNGAFLVVHAQRDPMLPLTFGVGDEVMVTYFYYDEVIASVGVDDPEEPREYLVQEQTLVKV